MIHILNANTNGHVYTEKLHNLGIGDGACTFVIAIYNLLYSKFYQICPNDPVDFSGLIS